MAKSSTSILVSLLAIFSHASFAHSVPTITSRSASSIAWSNCTASDSSNLDCGSIQVPLDHSKPNGGNITLAIARLKAPTETRTGNLLYNPGGPGGSATQILFAVAELAGQFFSQTLLDHYDIIGLDPRGVGLSAGISCDPDLWNARKSMWPTNEKEFDDMVTANKAFYASCANLTGPLLDNVDTTSVAMDFELVRLALGDEKLNFFGQSYGSQIGAQYAELFPENIGRMALDAILDHSTSEVSGIFVESQAYESTLLHFFAWCNTTTNCSFHAQDSKKIFQTLINQADTNPIPAPGCNTTGTPTCHPTVTGKDLLLNIQGLLHGQLATLISPDWTDLSTALAQAVAGDATLLSTPLASRKTDPVFATIAIVCQDWSHDATYSTLQSRMMYRFAATFDESTTFVSSQWYEGTADFTGEFVLGSDYFDCVGEWGKGSITWFGFGDKEGCGSWQLSGFWGDVEDY
ncbi:hypothetical protein E2P81_ATG03135 [Venturia nashicola]|uniref:AB hydrolase-1 domain-containing protein n=1 Tax=Venturia nashicola TaxID=86259 RepID=A0A4Z1PJL0_9PEZI|nr:hypothetical protein E6O75_ATG03206 [Venturia nashicola]TLD36246.1 hypothetical protein E2P81_ATG03135 [Venturia nashicola]